MTVDGKCLFRLRFSAFEGVTGQKCVSVNSDSHESQVEERLESCSRKRKRMSVGKVDTRTKVEEDRKDSGTR